MLQTNKIVLALCLTFLSSAAHAAQANPSFFDECIQKCDLVFKTRGLPELKNNYLASYYLAHGDPNKVIEHCDIVIRSKTETISSHPDVLAASVIMKSLAQQMQGKVPTELSGQDQRVGKDCWLAPMILCLKGTVPESEFVVAADKHPLDAGLSEAFFYLGVKNLLERKVPTAKTYLLRSAISPSDEWFSDASKICLQEVDAATYPDRQKDPPVKLPSELMQAETFDTNVVGKWTLKSNGEYESIWGNGATAKLKVTQFTGSKLYLSRTDTGATSGFTAKYEASWDGRRNRYVGNVDWTFGGKTWTGSWRATVLK